MACSRIETRGAGPTRLVCGLTTRAATTGATAPCHDPRNVESTPKNWLKRLDTPSPLARDFADRLTPQQLPFVMPSWTSNEVKPLKISSNYSGRRIKYQRIIVVDPGHGGIDPGNRQHQQYSGE
jgi:N-acetylmuramoyl-L-alanine amidase